MRSAATLDRLAARVLEEGPPLAVAGGGSDHGSSPLGELVAAGPRTGDRGDEYAFVVEAVREGYLCHYGSPRVLEAVDPDLALLAGDLFYAIGIRGLADLSDLIRVAADLQAADRSDLAEVLWLGQLVALACGKDEEHDATVKALEARESGAAEALIDWCTRTVATNELGREFDNAQNAIDSRPSNF
mgnify:CR=1 FL=1